MTLTDEVECFWVADAAGSFTEASSALREPASPSLLSEQSRQATCCCCLPLHQQISVQHPYEMSWEGSPMQLFRPKMHHYPGSRGIFMHPRPGQSVADSCRKLCHELQLSRGLQEGGIRMLPADAMVNPLKA